MALQQPGSCLRKRSDNLTYAMDRLVRCASLFHQIFGFPVLCISKEEGRGGMRRGVGRGGPKDSRCMYCIQTI